MPQKGYAMRKRVLTLWDGKVVLALLILAGCIITAFSAYRQIYVKMPDYAAKQIIRSVQAGDVETFNLYVDQEALTGHFFDALILHKTAREDQSLVLSVIHSPLRSAFVSAADLYITWTLAGNTDNDQYNTVAASLRNTLKSAGLSIPISGWHIDSADWSQDNTITFNLYNEQLDATVPCTVTMEKTPSDTWRITGLSDAKGFINDLQAVMNHELDVYNKPVRQKIDAIVTLQDVSAKLVSDQDKTFLRLSYTPIFHQDREQIATIKAIYTLHRSSDNAVLYTSPLRLSTSAARSTYESQFLLNPLIPSQYALIRSANIDDTTSTLEITAITLKDGTELALEKDLPQSY